MFRQTTEGLIIQTEDGEINNKTIKSFIDSLERYQHILSSTIVNTNDLLI